MRDELKIKSTPKRSWDIRTDDPLVSVCVQTFQHVPYIKDCLDGILMQETDFPFELLLQDDASTDGTAEICREYADRYPNIIRPFLFSENQYSKGVKPFIDLQLSRIRGKYSAVCEGDDYWHNPLKLQKQVDMMEADPSLALVHSDYDYIKVATAKRERCRHSLRGRKNEMPADQRELLTKMLVGGYFVKTCTALMRTKLVKIALPDIQRAPKFPMGDTLVWCELSQRGKFAYMEESMAAYRSLEESASNTQNSAKAFAFNLGRFELKIYVAQKYYLPQEVIARLKIEKIRCCRNYALVSGDHSWIRSLYESRDYDFPLKEKIAYGISRFVLGRALLRQYFRLRGVDYGG